MNEQKSVCAQRKRSGREEKRFRKFLLSTENRTETLNRLLCFYTDLITQFRQLICQHPE